MLRRVSPSLLAGHASLSRLVGMTTTTTPTTTPKAASSFRRIEPIWRRHTSTLSADKNLETRNNNITTRSSSRDINITYDVIRPQSPPKLEFRIIKHDPNDGPLAKLNAASDPVIELDDIEIQVQGNTLLFNLTWLRDSCHCADCTHRYSRQRLINIKDFDSSWFQVQQVELVDPNDTSSLIGLTIPRGQGNKGFVRVLWANGHESLYCLAWLEAVHEIAKKQSRNVHNWLETLEPRERRGFDVLEDDFYASKLHATQLKAVAWDVQSIESKLIPIDYNHLVEGFNFEEAEHSTFINANDPAAMTPARFESMMCLTRQLVAFGLAKIVNVPQERDKILTVAKSLAYERRTGYGKVFDVVVEPSEDINLAYSSLEFDLHSDLTYRETSPGVQLLHCITNSIDGGYSYFSDAFQAASELRASHPILFRFLCEYPASFLCRDPYRNVEFRRQKPIISLDWQNHLKDIYYNPFMIPPIGSLVDVKLFYLGMHEFTKCLQSKVNKYICKMEPGDLFIFHNRRVLHGRSAYDAKQNKRFLQGCYMDWDEIVCLHEKLQLHDSRSK